MLTALARAAAAGGEVPPCSTGGKKSHAEDQARPRRGPWSGGLAARQQPCSLLDRSEQAWRDPLPAPYRQDRAAAALLIYARRTVHHLAGGDKAGTTSTPATPGSCAAWAIDYNQTVVTLQFTAISPAVAEGDLAKRWTPVAAVVRDCG